MKILCLYNNDCALELFHWLQLQNNECVFFCEQLSAEWVRDQHFDLAVSYTYSLIIQPDVIEVLNNNIVNLHTSFLPWNRGVDPNMWSFIDGTPRGVTLHYIDCRLDKGFIIAQEIVSICSDKSQTLRSTYNELHQAAIELFKKAFYYYDYWPEMKKQAIGKGTYHTDMQGKTLRENINSFDMLVSDFIVQLKNKEN